MKKKIPKLSSSLEDRKKRLRADQFIMAFNLFLKPDDVFGEKAQLSEEELYYIAISVSDMKSIREQRTVFEMIHHQCDEESIFKFMGFFSERDKERIMISC